METRPVVGKTSLSSRHPRLHSRISSHMSIPNTTSLSQGLGSSTLQYRPESNRFERLCPVLSGCGESGETRRRRDGPRHFSLKCHHRGTTLEKETTPPRAALPPVPESCALNITRLGDAPVLEWLQRGGFPPWSLAFIPSQRNEGGTNLESKSHQSTTRGGGQVGFCRKALPGLRPHNVRSYPAVIRCHARKCL